MNEAYNDVLDVVAVMRIEGRTMKRWVNPTRKQLDFILEQAKDANKNGLYVEISVSRNVEMMGFMN